MSHGGSQEVQAAEEEEVRASRLSGPANSVESIDCGCKRYRLSLLARYATRRTFIVLLCCIGLIQAAAQAYFHVVGSTIARRYQIDPNVMEWVLYTSEIAPVLFSVVIAYWGDRIHRAAWLGGFTLVQCAAYVALVIPHIPMHQEPPEFEPPALTTTTVRPSPTPGFGNANTDTVTVPGGTGLNVTHMSIYAEESPVLCIRMFDKIFKPENKDEFVSLLILIIAQVVNGAASVVYYALGISYVDDNTKRMHVPIHFGLIVAMKVLGSVLGFVLAWGFLGIDADDLSIITSRTQVGAWWLGWPIFAVLLFPPALFMAIFPRRLPSVMIDQAASNILDQSGSLRGSQRISNEKVGSTAFFPSILRLITNKTLLFQILAGSFLMAGIVNFLAKENIFLESRFYAPRPDGMLIGFHDPLVSRTIATTFKPIVIGLIIIVTGFTLARVKPRTRSVMNFNLIILSVSALITILLAFNSCNKARIVGINEPGMQPLLRACNSDCQCSKDTAFRPICDSKGFATFFSPCHAGCTVMNEDKGTRTYANCTCVKEYTGRENHEAVEGPCNSGSCQSGWLLFEVAVMFICSGIASTIIGDLLISLRSVYPQDKALAIGFAMAIIGLVTYVPGKITYDQVSKVTCTLWGGNNRVCRLYSYNLGIFLCFLTAALIVISILLKLGVWFFAASLEIFDPTEIEAEEEPRELETLNVAQAEPLLQRHVEEESNQRQDEQANPETSGKKLGNRENGPTTDIVEGGESSEPQPLRYGPVGPGDRRADQQQSNASLENVDSEDEVESSDGSHGTRKGSVSQVAYKPLELDSDVESELSGAGSRSRKRVSGGDFDESKKPNFGVKTPFGNIKFPNPDNYEDPRTVRGSRTSTSIIDARPASNLDGQSMNKPLSASKGDFNELGIPIVKSYEPEIKGSSTSLRSPTVNLTLQQLDKEPCREYFGESSSAFKPIKTAKDSELEIEENRKFRLENLMQPPISYPPPVPTSPIRPPSRDQASSGFGSLQDIRERLKRDREVSDSRDSLGSNSPQNLGSPLCTDL